VVGLHDPTLDTLERQVEISNQTLRASEAAYRTALAIVGEGRSGYYPTLDASGSATRNGRGAGASSSNSSFSTGRASVQNSYTASAQASWVPDIWGSIRRTVESDVANAQASAADLAAAKLAAQSTLAVDYFQLRIADEIKAARPHGRGLYALASDRAKPVSRRTARAPTSPRRSAARKHPCASDPRSGYSARNSSMRLPCSPARRRVISPSR